MGINIRRTVRVHLSSLVISLALATTAIGQSNESTVDLVLQAGRPLQVALDTRITVRHVGQPITGTLVEPVYVYDRIVLPVGARVSGHIDRLEPAAKKRRLMAMLGGDFSPHRRVVVKFDTVTIGEGDPIAIETVVTGGGVRVKREVAGGTPTEGADEGKTSAARRARDKAAEEAHAAIDLLKEPGKAERLKEVAINALPYHPELLSKGAVYNVQLLKPIDFGTVTPTPLAPPNSLPAPDSILTARLTTTVTSGVSPRGTPIPAVLTHPIFSDQHDLILPEGTLLMGEVTYSTQARHMRRNGKLRVLFSSVQPPSQSSRPLLASLYSVQAGAAEHLVVDEEGGTSITNPKTRFIAPAVAALALAGSVHQEPDRPEPDDPFDAGEMQGNPGAQTLGGFVGFGFAGAFIGQLWRPAAIAFAALGLTRSVYSTVFAKGHDVSFAVDTPIQVRLAPHAASSKR
jgi:hypothetical protein